LKGHKIFVISFGNLIICIFLHKYTRSKLVHKMTHVFNAIEVRQFVRGDGIDRRISVRASTTGGVALGTNLNGASVDGITLAVGDRLLVKNQSEVAQVVNVTTVADVAGSLNNLYFFISSPNTDYYVWFNVGGAGVDPLIPGRTAIPVAFVPNATANTVATAVAAAIDLTIPFAAPPPGANIITVTNASTGYAPAATAQTSTFVVSVSTPGSGAVDHGIWTIGSGAGATYRSDDLLQGDEAAFVFCDCEAGMVNARTAWSQVNRPAVVGTNALSWVQRGLFNYTANQMFYANSGSTLAAVTPSANQILITNGSSVPTFSSSLPTGTTISGPFTLGTQVVSKDYVDSTAAGLDPKESVRVRTLADIAGTYNAAGGTSGTGAFTNVNLGSTANFDLSAGPIPVLAVGNRVLIMDQTDPKQNGIYVVTIAGVAGALERAADQNGSPAGEVSSGNFTFVETGAQYASTGWVLQGDGTLTLNTDPLNWVQFSAAGSWNGIDGITITGANISTDLLANGGVVYNGASPNGKLQVDLGASAISGTVAPSHGGTGFTTYTTGDLLIGNAGSLSTLGSSVRKVLTTDNTGAGVVAWRNDVHLGNILGNSALQPKLVEFTNTNAAVNFLTIANSLTTVGPTVAVAGTDANVDLNLATKGTGAINIRGDTNAGALRLWNSADTFYSGIQAGNPAANYTWTWPTVDGASGTVMRTDGAGVLSFVSLNATAHQVIPLLTIQANATGTAFSPVGYFDWDNGEFGTVLAAKLFYNADITGGKTLEVQVWNETTSTQLGFDSQTAAGFYKFAFTLPGANARLSVRIRKTTGGGANPSVYGASLIFNPAT
jgi:hypothetical protein